MRKIFLLPILALAIFFAANTAHAGQQDFILINNSGQTITGIFCSATKDWEENVLGGKVLPDGDTFTLIFPEDQTARYWDLKIVFESGEELYWAGIDLLKFSKLTLDSAGTIHFE